MQCETGTLMSTEIFGLENYNMSEYLTASAI
jgi:hypothetical protein